MGLEKRRAKRNRHDSVVEIFEDGVLKCSGRLVDYSATGISFSSEAAFKKGERLRARLRLLHKGVLEADGEVVWTRGGGAHAVYGVKFDSVNNVYPTGEIKDPWD